VKIVANLTRIEQIITVITVENCLGKNVNCHVINVVQVTATKKSIVVIRVAKENVIYAIKILMQNITNVLIANLTFQSILKNQTLM
jgi:hypothetical protein